MLAISERIEEEIREKHRESSGLLVDEKEQERAIATEKWPLVGGNDW